MARTQLSLSATPTWILSSAALRSQLILAKRLAQAGITGHEYRCLSALAWAETLSQTGLSSAAALDRRDVTHAVRALENRHLVSRTRDPRHGRRQLVALTDAGKATTEHLASLIEDVQQDVFSELSDHERKTLVALLERVGRAGR